MSEQELTKGTAAAAGKKKTSVGVRVLKYTGLALLLVILALLLVNSLLALFKPHYYPTFGNYRLFAIVSDSMDTTIPKGHMIVDTVPKVEADIKVGDIITFEIKGDDGKVELVNTHRVVSITKNPKTGEASYVTKGDNLDKNDSIHPDFSDVVGVYTGKHCGFFGYFFGFLQSLQGAITLMVIIFIILLAWLVLFWIKNTERRRSLENAALRKSAQQLGNVNLRYDNIREITAVMDVLGMVTEEPKTRAEDREVVNRLGEFVDASNIELPATPETAAVLDSLPAPDTPMTLAAALRNGATLRQAEDGQTLILTGMSGGKSILLTPVQTPDGIILCQQGVRLRSDLAPNIESVGAMSMPEYPEFFEGQPLEKNVEYPELPQPQQNTFGPDHLSSNAGVAGEQAPALSAPTPVGQAKLVQLDAGGSAVDQPLRIAAAGQSSASRKAYMQYRELAAQIELRQVEELSELLASAEPLSPEERDRIAAYKAERKKAQTPKPKKQSTPEQIEARRAAAAKRKEEHEAFLNALDPADRELYESEQKLSKARAATIRKLKRMNSDRKLLAKIK